MTKILEECQCQTRNRELNESMKKRIEKKIPKPTEAELAILHILWELGPSTARDVQLKMDRAKTTVLTLLQIMVQKGLVERDESSYAHVYKARFTQKQIQKQILRDIVNRAFDGSTYQLVMKALAMKKMSDEELKEIHRTLEERQK